MFFESINWQDLLDRKIQPPFKPTVKSEMDVQNFDKEFTDEAPRLTPPDEGKLISLSPSLPLDLSRLSLQVTPKLMLVMVCTSVISPLPPRLEETSSDLSLLPMGKTANIQCVSVCVWRTSSSVTHVYNSAYFAINLFHCPYCAVG